MLSYQANHMKATVVQEISYCIEGSCCWSVFQHCWWPSILLFSTAADEDMSSYIVTESCALILVPLILFYSSSTAHSIPFTIYSYISFLILPSLQKGPETMFRMPDNEHTFCQLGCRSLQDERQKMKPCDF